MNKTLKVIDKEIIKLQSARYRVENKEFREKKLPKLRGRIGKTYAYRNNSFGSSKPPLESPEDYWDMFRKLVAVELDPGSHIAHLIFRECFIDSDGKATLTLHADLAISSYDVNSTGGNWKNCPSKEFEEAWVATMAALMTHG